MEETYILYFKSYSYDKYFMKTKDSKCKELTSEQFAKQYIPYEYEAWEMKNSNTINSKYIM